MTGQARSCGHRRIAGKGGFTLMEVLVVLTITALLLSMIFRILTDSRQSAIRINLRTFDAEDKLYAANGLRDVIAGFIVPPIDVATLTDNVTGATYDSTTDTFTGAADSISSRWMASRDNPCAPAGAVGTLTLTLQPPADGSSATDVICQFSGYSADNVLVEGDPIALMTLPAAAKFTFSDDQITWADTWTVARGLQSTPRPIRARSNARSSSGSTLTAGPMSSSPWPAPSAPPAPIRPLLQAAAVAAELARADVAAEPEALAGLVDAVALAVLVAEPADLEARAVEAVALRLAAAAPLPAAVERAVALLQVVAVLLQVVVEPPQAVEEAVVVARARILSRQRLAAKSGFALPTVIMTLAILTVVMVGATVAISSYRQRAEEALEDANFQTRALSAEAYLTFLAITQPFNGVSLDVGGTGQTTSGIDQLNTQVGEAPIRLDNRAYYWNESDATNTATRLVSRIQDEAGLYNFSNADLNSLTYLFNNLGVDETISPLLAQEVIDYNTTRTTPVTPMRSLAELYTLTDANALSASARQRLKEIAVFQPNTNVENINTAPLLALRSWFNMAAGDAQVIIDTRETQPYTNIAQASVVTTATNATYVASTGRIRFTLTDPKTGRTFRSTIVITATDTERPFWIDNRQNLLKDPIPDSELTDAQTIPAIPDPAA